MEARVWRGPRHALFMTDIIGVAAQRVRVCSRQCLQFEPARNYLRNITAGALQIDI